MSNKKRRPAAIQNDEQQVVEAVVETVEVAEVAEPVKEEAAVKAPRFKNGVVTNCTKLNLRSAAKRDAAVVQVLENGAKVRVEEAKSTQDFYKVRFANVEGFCMKQYIAIEQ